MVEPSGFFQICCELHKRIIYQVVTCRPVTMLQWLPLYTFYLIPTIKLIKLNNTSPYFRSALAMIISASH